MSFQGRQRRRPAPKLVERFNLRVLAGQLDKWDTAARAEGLTIAEWLRLAADRTAELTLAALEIGPGSPRRR